LVGDFPLLTAWSAVVRFTLRTIADHFAGTRIIGYATHASCQPLVKAQRLCRTAPVFVISSRYATRSRVTGIKSSRPPICTSGPTVPARTDGLASGHGIHQSTARRSWLGGGQLPCARWYGTIQDGLPALIEGHPPAVPPDSRVPPLRAPERLAAAPRRPEAARAGIGRDRCHDPRHFEGP